MRVFYALILWLLETNICLYLNFQGHSSWTGNGAEGRIVPTSSANMTARGQVGNGMRGGNNPGIGPNASALSRGNTGGSYSGSNSSYSNRGRGANIPSGPRADVPPPRPPPKAVDPSAMEVLGLLPPERPPPPRSGGPPGNLDPNNSGPIHPAYQQQNRAPQQHHRPQQQTGRSHGGQPSTVSNTFSTYRPDGADKIIP